MNKLFLIITLFTMNFCFSQNLFSKKNQVEKFDFQGHRGCRGLMPENTIPAMIKAIDLEVTTLEMDVVITKDKKVILSHEPWFGHEISTKPDGTFFDEKTEKSFPIFKMNYEEVKLYDVGMKPHLRFPDQQKLPIFKPLLSDLLDAVADYLKKNKLPNVQFNIETKSTIEGDNIFHPKPDEFVDLLMKVIIEKQIEEQVIIQSFDFRTLQYLHIKFPLIKTAMLIEDSDHRGLEQQILSLGFIPTIYSPHFSLITKKLISECHQKKIKIIPWTVNEKKEIMKLKNWGADGIISDYPNLFQ